MDVAHELEQPAICLKRLCTKVDTCLTLVPVVLLHQLLGHDERNIVLLLRSEETRTCGALSEVLLSVARKEANRLMQSSNGSNCFQ